MEISLLNLELIQIEFYNDLNRMEFFKNNLNICGLKFVDKLSPETKKRLNILPNKMGLFNTVKYVILNNYTHGIKSNIHTR